MPISSEAKIRCKNKNKFVDQLIITDKSPRSLRLSTNYLINPDDYNSFNEFLHSCTNYDAVLDKCPDWLTNVVKRWLRNKVKILIKKI
jgi:uncharacterized protein VirK/YbjX